MNASLPSRPTLVLPDSNVLRAERLFASRNGAALLEVLERSGARILMPEVIEIELVAVLIRSYTAEVQAAKKRIGSLEALLGSKIVSNFPEATALEDAIGRHMTALTKVIVRAPFTLEVARSAMKRVIAKRPPSGMNNEQFRDCCIWQHCLEFGQENIVHLISADGDFAKNMDALMAEANSAGASIHHHATVHDFLNGFEPALQQLNNDKQARQISEALQPLLVQYAAEAGFNLGDLKDHKISIPESGPEPRLATFEIISSLSDPNPSSIRINPILQANGIFTLRADGAVIDPQVEDHRIEWTNRNGISEEYRVFANTASQPLSSGWLDNNSWEIAAQIAARRPFNPAIFAPSITSNTPPPLKMSDTEAKSE